MKKIMLILISVIILFTACENRTDDSVEESVQTQIDPSKEFDGITFGMTKDEIISFLGKEPVSTLEPDDKYTAYNYIKYVDEEHFNVSNAEVQYRYDNDHVLHCVKYLYNYDESEQKKFMNDYEVIKEEILKHYPKETWTYSYNYKTILTIYTENRRIFLFDSIDISWICVMIEEYEPAEYIQIDPTDEFSGITFGMTKDEVVKFHGRQPDEDFEDSFMTYKDETYFNINSTYAYYHFADNDKLDGITIMFTYFKDTKENSFLSDYNSIREELLKRYPQIIQYIEDTNDELWYFTDNRSISLSKSDYDINGIINVAIDDMEKYNNSDT